MQQLSIGKLELKTVQRDAGVPENVTMRLHFMEKREGVLFASRKVVNIFTGSKGATNQMIMSPKNMRNFVVMEPAAGFAGIGGVYITPLYVISLLNYTDKHKPRQIPQTPQENI